MASAGGPSGSGWTASDAEVLDGPVAANSAPIDLLLSYAFHDRLDHFKIKERTPEGSLLWIDSGAFTAYTTGKKITVEQYADHLEANRGSWDYAFTLDVIGDHRASMRQTEDLINRGYPVTPIFTFGTPLKEFRAMCRDYGYIGAGGIVPLAKDRARVLKYLRTLTHVADEYGTAVHALGMAGRQTVISTRVWSADSSTVSSAPLYGNVPIYSRKEHRLKMLQASDKAGLYKYRDDLLRYGFPLEKIMREGRWTKDERPAMFRASLLSVADMWADVRERFPRPAPERLPLPDSWAHGSAPLGPRPAYALGPGNGEGLEQVLSPRVASALGEGNGRLAEKSLAPDYDAAERSRLTGPRGPRATAPHDVGPRLDAALSGVRGPSAITAAVTSETALDDLNPKGHA